jgi:hypothetical protein
MGQSWCVFMLLGAPETRGSPLGVKCHFGCILIVRVGYITGFKNWKNFTDHTSLAAGSWLWPLEIGTR